jgi:hypothetical protein
VQWGSGAAGLRVHAHPYEEAPVNACAAAIVRLMAWPHTNRAQMGLQP